MEGECFRNVDLVAHQYIECASMLPKTAFKKKEKEDSNFHFLTLKSYSWHKAPEWDVVGRLCHSLNCLLCHSNGLNVHQKSFLGALYVWDQKAYSDKCLEGAVYCLRTLIAQMQWHKKNGRSVPAAHRRLCQVVFDAIEVPKSPKKRSSESLEDDTPPAASAKHAHVIEDDVESIASSVSDETFARDVFSTDNPELQKIFSSVGPDIESPTPLPATTDVGPAATDVESSTPLAPAASSSIDPGKVDADASMAALAAGCAKVDDVSPAAWAKLNKGLKGKTVMKVAKPKAKPKAKAKAKGTSKIKNHSWAAFLKREHSKVWHKERKYGTSDLGLSDEEAKKRAKEKASLRTAALKKQREKNQLKDFPPSPP